MNEEKWIITGVRTKRRWWHRKDIVMSKTTTFEDVSQMVEGLRTGFPEWTFTVRPDGGW